MSDNTFSARALSSDAEAADWGALCARGFAHRGGAIDRFFVRYIRDPAKKQDWVRVTVTPEGRFVGSVRIFDRRLDIDGVSHPACGLGEVCVDPEYRGKGVSNVSMPDAISVIEGSGSPFAILHAAAGVQGLYGRYGFAPLPPIAYGRLPLIRGGGSEETGAPRTEYSMRPADLDADTAALARIRASFIARLRITGFVERPDAAWVQLIPLVGDVIVGAAADGAVLAYAIIAKKNGALKVCDFGIADGVSPASARDFLLAAARAGATSSRRDSSVVESPAETVSASPPAAVKYESLLAPLAFLRWMDEAAEPEADAADGGWMVRPTASAGEAGERACAALIAAAAEGRFLLAGADSF